MKSGYDIQMNTRITFIDSLRGIAAICVMSHHYLIAGISNVIFVSERFDLGIFGVSVFFICSGFVISASIDKNGDLRHFWVRRFFRIYPLYWVNIGIWLCLIYILRMGKFNDMSFEAHPVSAVLANMTLLQKFWGVDYLVPLYWTLSMEIVFYIIFSVLHKIGTLRHTVLIALFFLGAGIIVDGLIPIFYGPHDIKLFSYLGMMFMGMVFYRAYTGEVGRKIVIYLLILAWVMEILTYLRYDAGTENAFVGVGMLTAHVGAYIFFAAALKTRGQKPSAFISYVGLISYSVYLMHLVVLSLIPKVGSGLTAIPIWIAVSIALSSITYFCIERPGIKLGRKITSRLSMKEADALPVIIN